jgi:Na+/proline symporter
MQDLKKNILDRFIENFSSEDLKRRVWAITMLGMLICVAIGVGGYFFVTTNFTVEAGAQQVPFWKLLWMGH